MSRGAERDGLAVRQECWERRTDQLIARLLDRRSPFSPAQKRLQEWTGNELDAIIRIGTTVEVSTA